MAQRGAMLPPTIKQEATAHLAAMMSPPAPAPPAPTAPAGVRVKRELPVGAQDLADLALPPPKRPRAAEVAVAAPSQAPSPQAVPQSVSHDADVSAPLQAPSPQSDPQSLWQVSVASSPLVWICRCNPSA